MTATCKLSSLLRGTDIFDKTQEEIEAELIGLPVKSRGPFSYVEIGNVVEVDKKNDRLTVELF